MMLLLHCTRPYVASSARALVRCSSSSATRSAVAACPNGLLAWICGRGLRNKTMKSIVGEKEDRYFWQVFFDEQYKYSPVASGTTPNRVRAKKISHDYRAQAVYAL